MPSVHELEGWAGRLIALLDELPADGITEDEVAEALHLAADEYEAAVEDKTHAIVRVLQAIEDRENTARRDKARADAAIRFHRRQRQRVRTLMRTLMLSYAATTERRKVVTTYATVSLSRRTEYAYPERLEEWPEEWREECVSYRPAKDRAREAIDRGEAPDGFTSHEVETIAIRSR